MMPIDLSAIATTLWKKISKPLPNLLVGLVFIFFAPSEVKWVGGIFWVIGISSIAEWLFYKAVEMFEEYKIKKKINGLTNAELEALITLKQIEKWRFENSFADRDHKKLYDLFRRMEDKGLVISHPFSGGYSGSSGYSFHLVSRVKKILQEIIEAQS